MVRLMRKLIFLLMPLALVVSNCDSPAAQIAAAEPANPDKFFKPETSDLPGTNGAGNAINPDIKPGDPLSPFNADNSLKPQFPKGVLPRLNALMYRTKDVIDEYDEIRPDIEQLVAAAKAAPGDTAKKAKAVKGIAQIRLHGACVGCPSSSMTLKVGIERNLKNHIPEIRGVEAVS